ncbi:winged helix DNA-binding domain-containing protein [Actinocorallia sp. API 0066]|uniref:DNA glycosylase AlkZ-like family protein n=1 Tax=Actinocorallia sp. API 0066 TaxID=2896846 RepID=UPI001E3C3318|nr:crosslink repair DNA glycosylase YcaQ family protein [Actinocorallia sp. API 0066]MCD0453159.1 winged helix DNA-binding domain-containing protein [Actinocorallia sp. API 0066]
MDEEKLRAFWAARQGLDGSLEGAAPAEVLAQTGWARSVGGFNPYLTIYSRSGTGRHGTDNAVADGRICEIRTARGRTYVLPEEDYGLGLRMATPAARAEVDACDARGVAHQTLDQLITLVQDAMTDEPVEAAALDLHGLLPPGEAGRIALGAALALLEASGEIKRVPLEGRLDRRRHGYVRWTPPPVPESTEARTALAEHYWRWIGVASLANFRWFSGLSEDAARGAVAPLDLHPQVDGDLLIQDVDEFGDFAQPLGPSYALVSALDGLHHLRHDLKGVLDPEHGDLRGLPAQAIIDRGRLIGFWDYDPDRGEIVWTTWTRPDDELVAIIDRAAAFLRDDLGDVRGTTPDSARPPALA